MRAVLLVLALLFLFLGGVNLIEVVAGRRAETQAGAALFAALFFGVAIVCCAFAIRGKVSFGRRRCPSCRKRISRRAILCQHCHRAVPIEE